MQHDPYLHSVRSLYQCKVQIHAIIRREDENASCLSAANEMILPLFYCDFKSPWPEHWATLLMAGIVASKQAKLPGVLHSNDECPYGDTSLTLSITAHVTAVPCVQ